MSVYRLAEIYFFEVSKEVFISDNALVRSGGGNGNHVD